MERIAGRYLLLKPLARGGMGEVHLARQSGLDGFEKLVVIKRILPDLAENPEFVRLFLDEARVAADLRHPNVVAVLEVGSDSGQLFLAMEYVHGMTMRRVQRRASEARRGLAETAVLPHRAADGCDAGVQSVYRGRTDRSGGGGSGVCGGGGECGRGMRETLPPRPRD